MPDSPTKWIERKSYTCWKDGRQYRIEEALDFDEQAVDVYLDGEFIGQGLSLSDAKDAIRRGLA